MLWNIDLTLVDVARVSRAAYAEAFERVTGRPLVALPQFPGRTDSEVFFEALALNEAPVSDNRRKAAVDLDLLDRFFWALGASFAARGAEITREGRLLPGAREALAAVSAMPQTIQSVLTGSIRASATVKLSAFHLDQYFDLAVAGFGSDAYPKGTLLLRCVRHATDVYNTTLAPAQAVYVADSDRDVEAATFAGAHSIGVASGRSTAAELRAVGADAVLTDLADTDAVTAAISRLTPMAAER